MVAALTQPTVQVTVMVAVPPGDGPAVAVKLKMPGAGAPATVNGAVVVPPVVSPDTMKVRLTTLAQAPVSTTLTAKLVMTLGAVVVEAAPLT